MNIAVVGGNLGGSYLSYLLAEKGFKVTVFDPKIPYEKACGGGISYKTYIEFPFLQELTTSIKKINAIDLVTHTEYHMEMPLNHPFHIVSRKELSQFLLDKAKGVGVQFISERVQDLSLSDDNVKISSSNKNYSFDFVVGADGARSLIRRKVKGSFPKSFYSLALGYYLKNKDFQKATLKFHRSIKGYIWIFPRADHLSIGIGSLDSNQKASELKAILNDYLTTNHPELDINDGEYFSAFVPSLPAAEFQSLKCVDNRWALIGDAAGFADPISGEGIYYALKSADLLANCFGKNQVADYDRIWKSDFGDELEKSASLSHLFYNPYFTESSVLIASKSEAIRNIISDLISGQQSYLTLKSRLLSHFLGCVRDSLFNRDNQLNKRLFENLKYLKSYW